MVEVFKYVDKFFTSLTNYLTFNYIFVIFVGLFLLTMFIVFLSTAKSYEARLIKAVDKFNSYFIDNPHINEDNLVAFNDKMKSKKVPKQLRKQWQQFVLYREDKASAYMSFENCVANPIKNSTYTRDVKLMSILAYVFSICALVLNCYYSTLFETTDLTYILKHVLLTPSIILLLNYIIQIFLNLRHNAIVSDLFQNYQYFEVNIDKATETIPEYVDYEVLFDRNEIKKGIPILYTYLQKRAEEEQRELERARLKNVEHEKFNFDDTGVAASLVLERAMQETENYIAERKKYTQDIGQINADITQEDLNYREITKEYNRQMQVSKETFENLKAQLAEASSTIESNYLKKQQQQELDRQRNLERDFDTATERHKKIIESYQDELKTVEKYITESRKNLEHAMKSEFSNYNSKVYDEAKKAVQENQKGNVDKLKQNIVNLEEQLVTKTQELDNIYAQNQLMNDKLVEVGVIVDGHNSRNNEPVENVQPERENYYQEEPVFEDNQPSYEENNSENYQYEDNIEYENSEEFVENPEYDNAEDLANEEYNNDEFEPYDEEEFNSDEFEPLNDSDFEDDYKSEEASEDEKVISTTKTDDSKKVSKRGRPKKVVSNETTGEKKKPGRPKKETVETEKPAVKKGRGRPKKVQQEVQVEEKRGRGRPKKEEKVEVSQPISKGPGRPKKEVVEAEKPAVKKGRGRPKKEETKSETSQKAEPKRGRGRPRKEEVQIEEVKRGRGRPKKETTETAKPAIKKGRGRPKKTAETILNDIDDIDVYLKEIDNAIAEESAKLEETQKELEKKARLRRKK